MEIKNEQSHRVVAELSREEHYAAVVAYVARHNLIKQTGDAKQVMLRVWRDEDESPDGCNIEIYY